MSATTAGEENERIVRQFVESVVNEGDVDRIDEFVAEGVNDHTPLGEETGRDAMRETTESLRTSFPDFTVTLRDVLVDGDTVAVWMTQAGTHEGEFMGYEPTGRSFEIGAMAVARIADGLIADRWVQPDMYGLLGQLGVVDASGA